MGKSRRLVGIDPGLRLTGFGVIETSGAKLRYIASGVIRVPSGDLPSRLKVIFDGLREVILEYRPEASAIEKVFVNVNPASTLLLGQARGAAITALVSCNVPVQEFTALQIKQSVTGYGRASKEQIQAMVIRLLNLPSTPSKDAADALACALCAAQAGPTIAATSPLAPSITSKGLRLRRGRLIAG